MRVVSILKDGVIGSEIKISGWIKTRRDSKGISFIELTDGSSLKGIQIVASKECTLSNPLEVFSTGASLTAKGTLVASPGKEQRVELQASSLFLHGAADPEVYPLQKKRHSNEFLRTIAHLRPRTNTFSAVFRIRSAAAYAVHSFFNQRQFVYVNTPIISSSDCEGAGEMFQVTTLPLENVPKNDKGDVDFSKDFFETPSFLTVSGQLEGELCALALKDIYTFGPTFRAENSNTARHLAEFWMIEPEMAFCDLRGNAALAEDFIKYVIRYVLDNCEEDMAFFNEWVEKGIINSLEKLVDDSFEYMTYTDAVKVLEKSDQKFEFPCHWGADLQTEHERYLTETHVGKPVFLTDYPREIKAFYMRLNDDEKTVAAMDLLVPRLGEIIGGSQREERLDYLSKRILEAGLPIDHYEWFLDTRRFGTVPHSGFGLGFERLVMYLTGVQNIRDSIPFPRTPGNATF